MDAISGQNYSGFSTANVGGGLLFMNALGQQMAGPAAAPAAAAAWRWPRPATSPAMVRRGPARARGACGAARSAASAASPATAMPRPLTYNVGGVATGVDYRIDPRFLVGLGIGFSSGKQWLGGFSGRGTSNSYQASALRLLHPVGVLPRCPGGLRLQRQPDEAADRHPRPAAAQRATGQTGANQFLGQVETGYRIGIYEPAAAVADALRPPAGRRPSTRPPSARPAPARSTSTWRSRRPTRCAAPSAPNSPARIDAGWRDRLALQLRLGWVARICRHLAAGDGRLRRCAGAAFTVFGAAPQRDAAAIGLAANTAIADATASTSATTARSARAPTTTPSMSACA